MAFSASYLLVVVVVLVNLCYGWQNRCERITVQTCQDTGYNLTSMPNFMDHKDQTQAERAVSLVLFKMKLLPPSSFDTVMSSPRVLFLVTESDLANSAIKFSTNQDVSCFNALLYNLNSLGCPLNKREPNEFLFKFTLESCFFILLTCGLSKCWMDGAFERS